MKLFSKLYARVMRWSAHPRAPWFLAGLAFAESSFFPIPPDVMLAPMTLAKPQRAWRFATIATTASVVGGMFGYLIGHFALESVESLLRDTHYWASYLEARAWFGEYGFWAVFLAGFSPIPYKVFTISAGALAMNFPLFAIASFFGRGGRFYLVSGLIRLGGERMEAQIRKHVDLVGWLTVLAIFVAIWWFRR